MCSDVFDKVEIQHTWAENLTLNEAPEAEKIRTDAVFKDLSEQKTVYKSQLDRAVDRALYFRYGDDFQWMQYKNLNSTERTKMFLLRALRRDLLHKGLQGFFEKDHRWDGSNRLRDYLHIFLRSRITQGVFTVSSIYGTVMTGALPFLPNIEWKIPEADLNTLLVHGIESPEGKELVKKWIPKQEAERGYLLFRSIYTRLAMAVAFYIVWDEISDVIASEQEKGGDYAMNTISKRVDEMLAAEDQDFPLTSNDFLLAASSEKIRSTMKREVTAEELVSLCQKIYKTECPARSQVWFKNLAVSQKELR